MKHYPQDLEQTAEQSSGHQVRLHGGICRLTTGCCGDRIAIVAEVDVRQLKTPDMAAGAPSLAIRRSIAELHGVLLEAVMLVAPGSIPKTTSGKLQRFACREAYLSDSLPARGGLARVCARRRAVRVSANHQSPGRRSCARPRRHAWLQTF